MIFFIISYKTYHTAIYEDWLQTLVTAVYHRIQYFFSYKIHSMVPSQTQHRFWWTPIDGRESRRFQLRYVGFQIELLLERRLLSRRRFVFLLFTTSRLCRSIICLLRSIFIIAFNNLKAISMHKYYISDYNSSEDVRCLFIP